MVIAAKDLQFLKNPASYSEVNVLAAKYAADASDKQKLFSFTDESSPLVITHNMNKRPSVSLVDQDERSIICDFDYNDGGDPLNVITIIFEGTFTGKVVLN